MRVVKVLSVGTSGSLLYDLGLRRSRVGHPCSSIRQGKLDPELPTKPKMVFLFLHSCRNSLLGMTCFILPYLLFFKRQIHFDCSVDNTTLETQTTSENTDKDTETFVRTIMSRHPYSCPRPQTTRFNCISSTH